MAFWRQMMRGKWQVFLRSRSLQRQIQERRYGYTGLICTPTDMSLVLADSHFHFIPGSITFSVIILFSKPMFKLCVKSCGKMLLSHLYFLIWHTIITTDWIIRWGTIILSVWINIHSDVCSRLPCSVRVSTYSTRTACHSWHNS